MTLWTPKFHVTINYYYYWSLLVGNLSEDNGCILSSADCSLNDSLLTQWIGSLGLSVHEKCILESTACLTANHISAASKLLKSQFPSQNGLQDMSYLLQKSVWNSSPHTFVQIIFVNPNHWACLSNIFSEANTIDLYDSALTIPSVDGSILKQASLILHELIWNLFRLIWLMCPPNLDPPTVDYLQLPWQLN